MNWIADMNGLIVGALLLLLALALVFLVGPLLAIPAKFITIIAVVVLIVGVAILARQSGMV